MTRYLHERSFRRGSRDVSVCVGRSVDASWSSARRFSLGGGVPGAVCRGGCVAVGAARTGLSFVRKVWLVAPRAVRVFFGRSARAGAACGVWVGRAFVGGFASRRLVWFMLGLGGVRLLGGGARNPYAWRGCPVMSSEFVSRVVTAGAASRCWLWGREDLLGVVMGLSIR